MYVADIVTLYVADGCMLRLASPRRLNEKDSSSGYIKLRLRIDTSAPRTVDELGLEHASRVLENAERHLETRKDGQNRVFDATSNVIDQGLGYAAVIQSGYSEVHKVSDSLGVLGEALIHFDKFVQLMDGLACVSLQIVN
jgi:hypothetical protein